MAPEDSASEQRKRGRRPYFAKRLRASRNVTMRFHTGDAEGPEKRKFRLFRVVVYPPFPVLFVGALHKLCWEINHRKHREFAGWEPKMSG